MRLSSLVHSFSYGLLHYLLGQTSGTPCSPVGSCLWSFCHKSELGKLLSWFLPNFLIWMSQHYQLRAGSWEHTWLYLVWFFWSVGARSCSYSLPPKGRAHRGSGCWVTGAASLPSLCSLFPRAPGAGRKQLASSVPLFLSCCWCSGRCLVLFCPEVIFIAQWFYSVCVLAANEGMQILRVRITPTKYNR